MNFDRKLSNLLQKAKRFDIVIMVNDFNAQINELYQTERILGESCSVLAQQTDNSHHLLYLYSENQL